MEAHKTTPQPLSHDRRQSDKPAAKLKDYFFKTWRGLLTLLNIFLLIAILGSMQQLYKAINTLTELNANCIMNPKIHQSAAPNTPSVPASGAKK